MSDGKSKADQATLEKALQASSFGYDVPIFSIAFGDADGRQLEELSKRSSATSSICSCRRR
jgi:hypothetical protein